MLAAVVVTWLSFRGDDRACTWVPIAICSSPTDQIPTYLTTTLPGAAPHCQPGPWPISRRKPVAKWPRVRAVIVADRSENRC